MAPGLQWALVALSLFGLVALVIVLVIIVNSLREWLIIRTIAKYTGTVPDSWPRFRQASWDYPEEKSE